MQPVVLIPGFTGTRLRTGDRSLWRSLEAMGAPNPPPTPICPTQWWREQMELQPDGITPRRDPESNRNREGLDAIAVLDPEPGQIETSQYFLRLIETLVAHGYGPENLRAAAYDWRVGPVGMALRYGYFDALRSTIEELGQPVALITHSMGCRVAQYFLQQAGPEWTARHIGRFIAVSALWLGVPKSVREAVTDVGSLGLTEIEGVKPLYQSWGALPWMTPVTEAQYRFLNTEAFAFLGSDVAPLTIVETLTRGGAESTLRFQRDYYEENPFFTQPGEPFGSLAVECPRVRQLNIFHATEQQTEVGAYYQPGPGTTLLLDTAATSSDPNFLVQGGVRLEVPGRTLQAIDGTRNSGDGFLPYGSLTYYKVWQQQPSAPEITARAFPGRTHYDILEDEAFLREVVALVV